MSAAAYVGQDDLKLESYVAFGATAVLFWDILLHIPEDYKQIRLQGFWKLSRVIYCFSRLTTLFYMVALCVIYTTPMGDCNFIRYAAYTYPLTMPFGILLLLFRVYALFRNKSYVLVFGLLSWLLVLGSSIAFAVFTEGMEINGTNLCTWQKIDKRNDANAIATSIRFVHDILVFVATSYWLHQSNSTDNRSGLTSVVFGKNLAPFTRSLLYDGQAYYLVTLILNAIAVVLLLQTKPFVPPCTVIDPLFVLISNLACHVYRNLIAEKYRDHSEFLQWQDSEWHEDRNNTRRRANIDFAMKRVQSASSSL